MNARKSMMLATSQALFLTWSMSVNAQLINGDDLVLTDPTPDVVFDDTDSPGRTYRMRGFNEYFLIRHEPSSSVFFQFDPSLQSTSLGSGATAGGSLSIALGREASTTGSGSTAVGWQSSASGFGSVAVGYNATTTLAGSVAVGRESQASESSVAMGFLSNAGGNRSTALGYAASAPIADTMILGQVSGANGSVSYTAVGMGTTNPLASLHVARNDGTAQVLVEETNANALPRTLFRLASAGSNAKFEIDNTTAGVNWAFTNAGSDFRVSRQGSGVVEFSVANNGNATLAGALTQNSDRNAKQDIVAVNPDEVLEKVAALPVSMWAYKDAPEARHLGPMAQDFHVAFGLGETDTGISSIDTGGVALAAIQALDQQNRALRAELASLREEVASLRTWMAQKGKARQSDQL